MNDTPTAAALDAAGYLAFKTSQVFFVLGMFVAGLAGGAYLRDFLAWAIDAW